MFSSTNTIAAIDIGTNKIAVLIARLDSKHNFEIIGIGIAPSHGLKKGVVVNIEDAVNAIRIAIANAQTSAGVSIRSASVGISGSHIHTIKSHGVTPVERGSITEDDIANAIAAAKAIPISEGEQILHVLPQSFIIDGDEVVHNPLGLHGIRLEAKVHLVLGRISSVQNLLHCCQLAGLKIHDIVLEQLASSASVLTKDEQRLGVGLLDIGGGTSDLALYKDNSICGTFVIPVAGDHFTADLAIGLKTTINEAERIKKEFGVASLEFLHDRSQIEIHLADDQQKSLINLSEVVNILEPRARELMSIVYYKLKHVYIDSIMTSGLVLTGGGSLLSGIQHVAANIFHVPVRVGKPFCNYCIPSMLESPMYATGIGLLIKMVEKRSGRLTDYSNLMKHATIINRMKNWVGRLF